MAPRCPPQSTEALPQTLSALASAAHCGGGWGSTVGPSLVWFSLVWCSYAVGLSQFGGGGRGGGAEGRDGMVDEEREMRPRCARQQSVDPVLKPTLGDPRGQ